jgi:hypothetical protein
MPPLGAVKPHMVGTWEIMGVVQMRRDKNCGHGPPYVKQIHVISNMSRAGANRIISFFVMIVYDLFLRIPVMGYRKGNLI